MKRDLLRGTAVGRLARDPSRPRGYTAPASMKFTTIGSTVYGKDTAGNWHVIEPKPDYHTPGYDI